MEKPGKAPRKQKSSLQLKRERIIKNLKKIEERALAFREKLANERIYNATQIEEEHSRPTRGSDDKTDGSAI